MTVVVGNKQRFETLDSFRGLCACLVCLYHFEANSSISNAIFVRQSWMFVDFFFVLSGFVIAHSYFEKLNDLAGLRNFLILRMARLYPLHIATLMIMICIELARYMGVKSGSNAFLVESRTIYAIFTNFLLIQSLNLHSLATWNAPSWSISAEWWTYIGFAFIFVFFSLKGRLVTLMFTAVFVPCLFYFWFNRGLNVIYDFGLLRCFYGFFIGVLCLFARRQNLVASVGSVVRPLAATCLEIFSCTFCIAFVSKSGEDAASLLAPLVFFLVIFVFSFELGLISQFLKKSPFVLLGKLSFSIYMVHWLVHTVVYLGLDLGIKFGLPNLWFPTFDALGKQIRLVGRNDIEGTVFHVLVLLGCVAVSFFTYRFVELPGQSLGRKIVARLNVVRPVSSI